MTQEQKKKESLFGSVQHANSLKTSLPIYWYFFFLASATPEALLSIGLKLLQI